MVKFLLHLEGLVVFLTSVFFYYSVDGGWLLFLLLFLTPDLSMAGYLIDKKIGAITYNLIHNYVLGLVVIVTGIVLYNFFIMSIGLILTAHIGLDRLFGFGLKYKIHFRDTHMQKV